MESAGDALGVASEPFDISAEILEESYSPLPAGAENYAMHTPEGSKQEHRRRLLDALSIVEFQASWFVLRGHLKDEEIRCMGDRERQENFIRSLYSDREVHSFFETREKAITSLAEVGLIRYEEYSATLAPTLRV